MFSPETIAKIGSLTSDALSAVQAEIRVESKLVALPEGIGLHSLEKFAPGRYRFRGAFATGSLYDFGDYVKEKAEPGAIVAVDPKDLSAVATLNLGTTNNPGHADSRATLKIDKSAAYAALLQIDGKKLNQQDAAEWLEDWAAYVDGATATDSSELSCKQAVAAIRRITIEAARKIDSDQSQLGSTRSTLEAIEAKSSAGLMPAVIHFACKPADGFMTRSFSLRVSVITSEKPQIVLRIAGLDGIREEIGNEFRGLISSAVGDSAGVLIGSFAP
ncbi:MAG: DUF2303 family protein [Gammaproteobacteria bacterium]|nr:DUF2303 family protein [Gammaproteobacteria bacterium]